MLSVPIRHGRVPGLDSPFGEEIFPNIQPKPLLAQLEAVSSHHVGARAVTADNRHLGCPAEDSALGRQIPQGIALVTAQSLAGGLGFYLPGCFFPH